MTQIFFDSETLLGLAGSFIDSFFQRVFGGAGRQIKACKLNYCIYRM